MMLDIFFLPKIFTNIILTLLLFLFTCKFLNKVFYLFTFFVRNKGESFSKL